jgi:hypothetical protein
MGRGRAELFRAGWGACKGRSTPLPDDFDALFGALVADAHVRARYQRCDLVLALTAKGARECVALSLAAGVATPFAAENQPWGKNRKERAEYK